MHHRRLLLAVTALVVMGAACDFPNVVPLGGSPLRYRDAIFNLAVETPDITYGSALNYSGETVNLQLDMYAPPAMDKITSRPAIVWVHGGGFSVGDKTAPNAVDEAITFAKAGYVTASIDYRLEPNSCFTPNVTATCHDAIREATQDAKTAVRFLRTHAAIYGIDPTRIAIGGLSAGAITALEVGYDTGGNAVSGVRAAVSVSGGLLSFRMIGPGDAPALLFNGTADPTVPYQWAVNTVKAARAAHLDAFLETWPGAGHLPYTEFRTQILTQTRNFLYWEMDLEHAAQ